MTGKVLIVEDQFVEADYLRVMLNKAGYKVTGIAHSVIQARESISNEVPDFVLLDIFLKGKLTGIDLAKELREQHIAFVYLSANSNEVVLNMAKATQPYGFLVKPFREKDLLVTLEIARYRHDHSVEVNMKREQSLKTQVNALIDSSLSHSEKLLSFCKIFQPFLPFDYVTFGFNCLPGNTVLPLSFLRIGYNEYQQIGLSELANITRLNLDEIQQLSFNQFCESEVTVTGGKVFENYALQPGLTKLFHAQFKVRSSIEILLTLQNGQKLQCFFYHNTEDKYTPGHIALIERFRSIITELMQDINLVEDISSKKNLKPSIEDAPNRPAAFNNIIGNSHSLLNIFDLAAQVANADTSVLILGESGTGKERIADSIHQLSLRCSEPLVKINCATLSANLMESELFGHEKGAFTGAMEKRIGKFEKANKGTVFLDEIGEMTGDLQVKLLRVLQERYIERIGSRDITKVDVRIIAATNKNLEKEVAAGRFRLDLYYRLNVFPITLPALRDRKEDIPALVEFFISSFNQKTSKKISGVSDKALRNMIAYDWPGNIRELENVVERAVLLTKEGDIQENVLFLQSSPESSDSSSGRMKTIHENEKDYIIQVLKKCGGKIWGQGGAAEILNLPASTLKSRMKKLNIGKFIG